MTSKKNKIIIDNSQPIFVGMDIHKSKWSICIVHQGEVVKKATIPGDFYSLEKLLEKYKDTKIYSVYEAGFSGFHLHYKLMTKEIKKLLKRNLTIKRQVVIPTIIKVVRGWVNCVLSVSKFF